MSKLINVDMGDIANGLFGLVDNLFTTDEERMKAKIKMIELQQAGKLGQLKVNAEEAKHESIFVAGWRPFIGWVCGTALAYHFILQPFLIFLISTFWTAVPLAALPQLDMASLLTLLGGLLGLGSLRTFEKKTGTNKNR